ncbi:hypothetical protein [Agitococcus lubricus]|uniref:Membrane protein DUF2157 n=1 Tax=Agitococcus lubricus TaxID=1077255 RepID=A0A2T5J2J0_9GAMM|nr:hypothetical protein [Agitococcus lubricus]PTQ90733.1 hypothetical protein C8N29_102133 [Agitococcus lubricus]
MYNDEDLDAAVAAKVLSTESVQAFRQFITRQRQSQLNDEEHFRLLSGFNDIFVAIAAMLFVGSMSWLGNLITPLMGASFMLISSWLLAESFVRKRRLALPAIVLLVSFIGGVFWLSNSLLAYVIPYPSVLLLAAVVTLLASYLHWRRFQVPITVATAVAFVLLAIISFMTEEPSLKPFLIPLFFLGGISSFIYAMWWDSQDRYRQTRKSDVAFWLHLLAAPLIVHPIFTLIGIFDKNSGLLEISLVLLLYGVLGLISLAVDRRALMLSALLYVLYALTRILKLYGGLDMSFAIASVSIGGLLLVLSIFWHQTRSAVVQRLPLRYQQRLPALQ